MAGITSVAMYRSLRCLGAGTQLAGSRLSRRPDTPPSFTDFNVCQLVVYTVKNVNTKESISMKKQQHQRAEKCYYFIGKIVISCTIAVQVVDNRWLHSTRSCIQLLYSLLETCGPLTFGELQFPTFLKSVKSRYKPPMYHSATSEFLKTKMLLCTIIPNLNFVQEKLVARLVFLQLQ